VAKLAVMQRPGRAAWPQVDCGAAPVRVVRRPAALATRALRCQLMTHSHRVAAGAGGKPGRPRRAIPPNRGRGGEGHAAGHGDVGSMRAGPRDRLDAAEGAGLAPSSRRGSPERPGSGQGGSGGRTAGGTWRRDVVVGAARLAHTRALTHRIDPEDLTGLGQLPKGPGRGRRTPQPSRLTRDDLGAGFLALG
jgi:hypothetical protein